MNKICISNVLKKLRRKHGITQTEFAEFLCVSKAAVSKWENNLSYPDVVLLPQIASYFNVTVDEILNYQPQLSKKEGQQLCDRLSSDFSTKEFDVVMEECRSLFKKYYSCFTTLYQIAVLIVNHRIFAGELEAQNKAVAEAKTLCQRIVSNADDLMLIQDATYIQCICDLILVQPDDVFKLIGNTLSVSDLPKDFLISRAYQLYGLMDKASEQAYNHAQHLIEEYNAIALEPYMVHGSYLIGANLYCLKKNCKEALNLLDKYGNLCDKKYFPYKFKGDAFFVDIDDWLDSDTFQSLMYYDKKMFAQNMLQGLKEFPSFKALYNEPPYQRLVKRINNFK